MKAVLSRLWLAVLIVGLATPVAFAQNAKSGLTGFVKDAQGGGIPGATVVVKNVATGTATTVQTNGSGNWAVPSLDSGQYTVTVSLTSFKTVNYEKVGLTAGQNTNINTVLEVGGVTDVIKVTATTQLVETSNTNVTTTVSADQMNNLPQVTKNALQFVTFLPGVNTGSSHVQRSTTIVGLPPSALAITLDGVNVMDQYLKDTSGSSFFAIIRPQTDLIEEVTVSEATPGADSSSGGAVQIKFVTRSGSNQPNGSAYEYLRHPALNTNSFTNTAAFGVGTTDLPKNNIIVNQYGFRQGGPIVIPGLYDGHGKAFYFFNYEEFRLPSSATRNRTVLAPLAQTGVYVYGCSATTALCGSSADLFKIAAQYAGTNPVGTLNGVANTPLNASITANNVADPYIANMLNAINVATGVQQFAVDGTQVAGSTLKYNTDRNTLAYSYQPPALRAEHIPGGRVDFNLTSKERLSGTYQFQKVKSNPDELNGRESTFPGLDNHGAQYSFRNSGTATLRSTLTANIVNEASWGFLWDPVYFFADISASQFDLSGIPGQSGTGFATNLAGYVTSPFVGANAQGRNGSNYNIRDTVSWLKGKHSLSFGFNFQKITGWNYNYNIVPSVNLGVDTTNDPVASGGGGMFTTAFFPGATAGELTNARALYAMLTGRTTSINGSARINPDGTYSYEGLGREDLFQREAGFFVQDQWHLRSNLTLNAGLRYELQFPITPSTNVYSQNTLTDFCGAVGQGAGINPQAVEAVKMGLPCQFGIPGYPAGVTPYVYTAADGVAAGAIGTSKCAAPLQNTSSAPALSTVAPCPTYTKYTAGVGGWSTDWNNFAPSIGVAWQPNVQHGFGRKLLGDPALATVRASYSRSFNVVGISTLQGPLENGPGLTFNSNRNTANNNLCPGGGNNCFPMIYNSTLNAGGIGAPPACTSTQPANGCVPTTLQFPQPLAVGGNGIWIFNPNYSTSYSDSYSVGLQRAISKDMSIEVRYIRTRNYGGDSYREYGEANMFTNPFGTSSNFLDEFQKAQANIAINVANGKPASIAPSAGSGANGFLPGQQPLPILLASYVGVAGCGAPSATYGIGGSNASAFCAGAGDATKYTGTQWTNTSNIQAMSLLRPNAQNFALTSTSSTSNLFWNPTFRANGIQSGMPLNFWMANPDSAFNGVETAYAYTKYDSVQVILNRRLSRGLQVSANYAYQIQYGSSFLTMYRNSELVRSSSSPPNSFKLLINYDVPVGKGKRFGTNMATWLDGIIGNWQLNMTSRIENGALVDIGNVQLKNMSLGDVQKAFHYYRNDKPQVITTFCAAGNTLAACSGAPSGTWQNFTTVPDNRWYDLPLDIVINSQRAFSIDPKTANGFTACTAAVTVCNGADPNSRHFEPASTLKVDSNGAVSGCSAIFVTDCGIRQQFIVAPLFTRFEFSAKKRFPFARRGSFDVEIDALNLFNAVDFNNPFSAQGGSNVIGSAYQDISNTFDPGGRLIQLVFRVNW